MGIRINLGNGARTLASNRCLNCDHEWRDKPMGFARHLTCPRCNSEYWAWVNYETKGE